METVYLNIQLPVNKSYAHCSVLIVDDHEINKMVMESILDEYYHIAPSLATNGQEAVQMVAERFYDLIFMDINMPVMDGIEAARMIKKLYPHIPIIPFTTELLSDYRSAFSAVGMVDYLAKPIDPIQLHSIIEKYLDNSLAS